MQATRNPDTVSSCFWGKPATILPNFLWSLRIIERVGTGLVRWLGGQKHFAAKLEDDLNLILGTYMVEGEKWLQQAVFCCPHDCHGIGSHHTY